MTGPGARAATATSDAVVTPSDSTVLNCVALYVGTGGDLSLTLLNSSSAKTYKNVPSGTTLGWASCKFVNAATTASDIVALYS